MKALLIGFLISTAVFGQSAPSAPAPPLDAESCMAIVNDANGRLSSISLDTTPQDDVQIINNAYVMLMTAALPCRETVAWNYVFLRAAVLKGQNLCYFRQYSGSAHLLKAVHEGIGALLAEPDISRSSRQAFVELDQDIIKVKAECKEIEDKDAKNATPSTQRARGR